MFCYEVSHIHMSTAYMNNVLFCSQAEVDSPKVTDIDSSATNSSGMETNHTKDETVEESINSTKTSNTATDASMREVSVAATSQEAFVALLFRLLCVGSFAIAL